MAVPYKDLHTPTTRVLLSDSREEYHLVKITSFIAAVISSIAPLAFADPIKDIGAHIPVEDYHYGMQLDVASVLQRTDNSNKSGVVPTILVYRDSQGEVHKMRYLEWGGKTQQNS